MKAEERIDEDASAVERAERAALAFTFSDKSLGADEIQDLFASFRRFCPVAKTDLDGGAYLVTRSADISRCLRDSEFFTSAEPLFENVPCNQIPLNVDPPMHALYRKDLNPRFALAKILEMESSLDSIARDYLKPIAKRGRGELIAEFAGPFPCDTFMLLLGAPHDDLHQLLQWKDAQLAIADGTPEALEGASDLFIEITKYFGHLLDLRAGKPDAPDDLLTVLTNSRVGDRPYTREEMISFCTFLMGAGLDTVTGMLARFIWFLAEHPGHRAQLQAEPGLIPSAIEEMLRYFTSVSPWRHAKQDVELGGMGIKAGERLELLLPSGSRDEAAYDKPELVDFRREHNSHFAFGGGPHRCLGSNLARTELRVALTAFLEMIPDFRLDPDHEPTFRFGRVSNVPELHIICDRP